MFLEIPWSDSLLDNVRNEKRPAIFLIPSYLTDGATNVLEQFSSSASVNYGTYNAIE